MSDEINMATVPKNADAPQPADAAAGNGKHPTDPPSSEQKLQPSYGIIDEGFIWGQKKPSYLPVSD